MYDVKVSREQGALTRGGTVNKGRAGGTCSASNTNMHESLKLQ